MDDPADSMTIVVDSRMLLDLPNHLHFTNKCGMVHFPITPTVLQRRFAIRYHKFLFMQHVPTYPKSQKVMKNERLKFC